MKFCLKVQRRKNDLPAEKASMQQARVWYHKTAGGLTGLLNFRYNKIFENFADAYANRPPSNLHRTQSAERARAPPKLNKGEKPRAIHVKSDISIDNFLHNLQNIQSRHRQQRLPQGVPYHVHHQCHERTFVGLMGSSRHGSLSGGVLHQQFHLLQEYGRTHLCLLWCCWRSLLRRRYLLVCRQLLRW